MEIVGRKTNNIYNNFYKSGNDYSRAKKSDTVFIQQLIEKLVLPKNSKVLDLGCGTGYFLRILYDLKITNLYGTDFSKEAIRWARSNNQGCDIKFSQMDTNNLDFSNSEFNLVLTIGHSPFNSYSKLELIQLISKISSVIKKNGYLVFIHSTNFSNKWSEGKVEKMYNHSRNRVIDIFERSNLFQEVLGFSNIRLVSHLTKTILFSPILTYFTELLVKNFSFFNLHGRLIVIGKLK